MSKVVELEVVAQWELASSPTNFCGILLKTTNNLVSSLEFTFFFLGKTQISLHPSEKITSYIYSAYVHNHSQRIRPQHNL